MAPPTCAAGQAGAAAVDQALNPRVAALKPSKTMALTDLALALREQVRAFHANTNSVRQKFSLPNMNAKLPKLVNAPLLKASADSLR